VDYCRFLGLRFRSGIPESFFLKLGEVFHGFQGPLVEVINKAGPVVLFYEIY
jgi:hypothetical protein